MLLKAGVTISCPHTRTSIHTAYVMHSPADGFTFFNCLTIGDTNAQKNAEMQKQGQERLRANKYQC